MARMYQDCLNVDGKLIGRFDGIYRDFEDPSHQSRPTTSITYVA